MSSFRVLPISLLVMAMTTFSSHAAVDLIVDSEIDILVVNGKTPSGTGSIFSSAQTYELPDGVNQIAFRYSYNFEKGGSIETVESVVSVTKFTAKNQEITIQLPKFKDVREAERSINNASWSILDVDSQQPISFTQDKLIHNGFQLGREYTKEIAEYNRTSGPAAVSTTVVTQPVKKAVPAIALSTPVATDAVVENAAQNTTVTTQTPNTAEEMLYFWYQKADDKTKAKFKAFVNQQ